MKPPLSSFITIKKQITKNNEKNLHLITVNNRII